jgi:hypothetical protein
MGVAGTRKRLRLLSIVAPNGLGRSERPEFRSALLAPLGCIVYCGLPFSAIPQLARSTLFRGGGGHRHSYTVDVMIHHLSDILPLSSPL